MSLLSSVLASARAILIKYSPQDERREIEKHELLKEVVVELKKLNDYMALITGENL